MPRVEISGQQNALPTVKLDGKKYFVMSDTYSRQYNEAIVTEKYTPSGGIDRQKVQTNKHRWEMTFLVPTSYAAVSVNGALDADVGLLTDLHASAYKVAPDDLLWFYDIELYESFVAPSHYVYLALDRETPMGNDPSRWQVPVRLWGYNA
jgi:hypothetical protein